MVKEGQGELEITQECFFSTGLLNESIWKFYTNNHISDVFFLLILPLGKNECFSSCNSQETTNMAY